jgi:hypothetical protein
MSITPGPWRIIGQDIFSQKKEYICSWSSRNANAQSNARAIAAVPDMIEALEKIASGMGKDLLGTTSLDREDMQDIAKAALERVKGKRT